MKRRTFATAFAALATLPVATLAGSSVDYAHGVIENALSEGKTVFVDYAADWCSTCTRQERIINSLRSASPDYDRHVVFVRVDWYDFGREPVSISPHSPPVDPDRSQGCSGIGPHCRGNY